MLQCTSCEYGSFSSLVALITKFPNSNINLISQDCSPENPINQINPPTTTTKTIYEMKTIKNMVVKPSEDEVEVTMVVQVAVASTILMVEVLDINGSNKIYVNIGLNFHILISRILPNTRPDQMAPLGLGNWVCWAQGHN